MYITCTFTHMCNSPHVCESHRVGMCVSVCVEVVTIAWDPTLADVQTVLLKLYLLIVVIYCKNGLSIISMR